MKVLHTVLFAQFYFQFVATQRDQSSNIQQQDAIKPTARWANECVLMANKGTLVCYGGQLENNLPTNSMYSLNLAQPWNTSDPAWSLLETSDANIPLSYFAATILTQSHQLFLDGGILPPDRQVSSSSLVYDTLQNEWMVPALKGPSLTRRKQHTAVSDDQGRIWLWGGLSDASTHANNITYYNELTVIYSQNWSVTTPEVENNPPPRIDHTATMILNKYILFIGGVVYSHDVTDPAGQLTLNPVSMSSLVLFDIPNMKWVNITAGGNIPAPRRGHSAVLSNDNKSVIIFGGGTPDGGQAQLNDVFILELETMRWTAPAIKGVPPKPRKYHKAYLIGDLLLVAFGLAGDNKGFDDINILSTSTWSWTSQYSPNTAWLSGNGPSNGVSSKGNASTIDSIWKTGGPTTDASSETRIKAGVIAGVVSGSVVILGGAIFLLLSFVMLKRKKVKASKKSTNSNIVDPASIRQDDESNISDMVLEPMAMSEFQKPDNRSSICYAPQLDDGHYYKPNARNDD